MDPEKLFALVAEINRLFQQCQEKTEKQKNH
jgi:hypothetical protein